MAVDRADVGDVQERLGDVIGEWPTFKPPDEMVPVRADLLTAAYCEIDQLRRTIESIQGAKRK
jgi:hypothetical protein